jgi:hypothetical protein
MTVRTKELAKGTTTTTVTTIYTVPDGKTTIVKSLVLSKNATGTTSTDITVRRSGSSQILYRHAFGVAAEVLSNERVYWALEPGDELRIAHNSIAVDFWITGVELDGVAP